MIVVLIIERYPLQRKDVERNPRRLTASLKAAKYRGAVGGTAQAAGETEKTERWGHRG